MDQLTSYPPELHPPQTQPPPSKNLPAFAGKGLGPLAIQDPTLCFCSGYQEFAQASKKINKSFHSVYNITCFVEIFITSVWGYQPSGGL